MLHSAEGLLAVRHFEGAAIPRLSFHSFRPAKAVGRIGIVAVQRNEDASRHFVQRVDLAFESANVVDGESAAFDLDDDFVVAVFGLSVKQSTAVNAAVVVFDCVGADADVAKVQ